MLKILIKAARLRGRMGRLFCLLLVAAVLIPAGLAVSPVSAEGPPALPAIFYGTVTISGSAAPVGTVVQAQIASVIQGSYTVATAGSYGNMLVTNGNSGDTVQFLVNGVAAQTAIFYPGERNPVNLSTGGGGSAPAAPVLSSPASGSTGVSTTPTLAWSASTGATSYAVQVSTSSGFASIAFSQSGIAGTSVAVSPALSAGTLYYWRANATNAAGTSAWTTAWSFTTASVAPPAAPTLLSPSNGATGVANSPMLQWNPSTGATTYNVQVSTSSAFTSFAFTQSGSATAVTVSPALSNSTTYYWRANATGAGGTGSWSSTWSFTTGGGSTPSVPAFFRGVAYKNGAAANAKQVCAVINSAATCTTSDASGNYLVSVSGSPGDSVTFTVDGGAAVETATYQPGWMTNLDLHAGTGVLAVTTGSGIYMSSTTATLGGTLVSLSSLDTSATPSIDYGPTTAYEYGTWTMASMSTPAAFVTPQIGTGPESPPAGGLTNGQVIHFRAKVVGNSTMTTVYGADNTYTHTLPVALSVVTTSLPAGYVGTVYSSSPELRATGGTSTYAWTIATGSLPGWAALDAGTGIISGTPDAAGTSTFTVRVTDAALSTATSGTLTITITASTLSVTTGSGAYLSSTTASLGGNLTSKGAYSSVYVSIVYGSTSAYGNETTPQLVYATGAYSATLSGLTSGQVVYFKAKAVGNATGATPVYGTGTSYTHTNTSPCGTCNLGSTTGQAYGYAMAKYLWIYPCVAGSTTTVSHINLKASVTSGVKVAIYDDEGVLINANNSLQTVTAGCNTSLTIPATSIASGTTYWIAMWCTDQTVGFARNVVGDSAYLDLGGSMDTFPATISGIAYHIPYNGLICAAP